MNHLADDSNEMPSNIFTDKNNKISLRMPSTTNLLTTLRAKLDA